MEHITSKTMDVMVHKRAAIYIRVSTDRQEENGTSLETQEAKCLGYCTTHKYRVNQKHIYRDVWTGTEYYERPELTRLREDARKGLFDVVIIYAFDRLARKQVHQAVIIEDLRRQEVSIESVTKDFGESAIGQFMRNAAAFAAELELEKIKERTQRGRQAKLDNGKLLGTGEPAYGYEWNKDRSAYIINPQEAKIVKLIFKLYVEERYTIYATTMHLLKTKVPNRKQGKGQWVSATVARILKNPYYIGKGFSHKWDCAGGGLKRRDIEEYIPLAENTVPAIIDEETFNRAQEIREINKQNAGRNNRNPEIALLRNGYAICGGCGRNLVVKPSPAPGGYSYFCNRGSDRGNKCNEANISVVNLDKAARQYLKEIINDEAKLNRRVAEIEAILTTMEVDLEPINSQLGEIERQQRNCALGIAKAKDDYTIEILSGELEVLARTRKQLEDLRDSLMSKVADKEIVRSRIDQFRKKWTNKLPALQHSPTYEDEREAILILGVKVTVWNRYHEPRYTIKMVPPEIVSLVSSY